MRTIPLLVCFAFIAGCAPRQARPSERVQPPDLAASLPEDGIVVIVDRLENKWAMLSSDDSSGQQSLEFMLSHNGARMTMTAYLAVVDLRSMLLASKAAYAEEEGFVSSALEPLASGNGARFTFSGPPRGTDGPTSGEVRAWEVPGSGTIVVLSGLWLASMHRSVSADFEAVCRGVKASPK